MSFPPATSAARWWSGGIRDGRDAADGICRTLPSTLVSTGRRSSAQNNADRRGGLATEKYVNDGRNACGVGRTAALRRRRAATRRTRALTFCGVVAALSMEGNRDGAGIHVQIPHAFEDYSARAGAVRPGPAHRRRPDFLPRTDLPSKERLPVDRREEIHGLPRSTAGARCRCDTRSSARSATPAGPRSEQIMIANNLAGTSTSSLPTSDHPAPSRSGPGEKFTELYICSLSSAAR